MNTHASHPILVILYIQLLTYKTFDSRRRCLFILSLSRKHKSTYLISFLSLPEWRHSPIVRDWYLVSVFFVLYLVHITKPHSKCDFIQKICWRHRRVFIMYISFIWISDMWFRSRHQMSALTVRVPYKNRHFVLQNICFLYFLYSNIVKQFYYLHRLKYGYKVKLWS